MDIRVGFGYDVHRLENGLDFWLGGIKIPYNKGLLGHSDADVLVHTICDALLGAANLGDIGTNFPDSSEEYKDIDSKVLLKNVVCLLLDRNYIVGNIDVTVCLQKPKISGYIPEMKKVLSECMGIEDSQLSIKATTTEKIGFIGREEGVSSYAVVLIKHL